MQNDYKYIDKTHCVLQWGDGSKSWTVLRTVQMRSGQYVVSCNYAQADNAFEACDIADKERLNICCSGSWEECQKYIEWEAANFHPVA